METLLKNVLLAKFDCSPTAKYEFNKESVIKALTEGTFIKRIADGIAFGEYDQSVVARECEKSHEPDYRVTTINMELVSHRVVDIYFRNLRTDNGTLDVIYVYGDVLPCGPKAHAINPHRMDRVFGFRALVGDRHDKESGRFIRELKTLVAIDYCPNGVV